MGVCRYFLQGNCWYGDSCRFEHPQNAYNGFNQQNSSYSQVSQPNRFAALGSQGGGGQSSRGGRPGGAGGGATIVKDLSNDDIINIISQEMTQWEQTHMWQFSCFSYTKEVPCLPGLEDISHEEVRLKAYEAQKSGTFDSYKQWIAQLSSDYKAKKKELINPSPPMKLKLQEVINTLKAASAVGVTNDGMKGSGSVFSTTSQFSGAVGAGAPTQPSLLGSSQSNIAFGSNPTAGQNPPLFGGASQAGAFGGGASTYGTAGTGLFGKPASTASNVFGGGQQQSGGLFGKPATTSQTTTFGGAQPIFGGASGAFGASTPSAFGSTPAAQNLSGTTAQNSFGAAPPSTFGAAQSSFVGTPQVVGSSATGGTLYTPMDKLTAGERAQFEAATFTLGKIPTRPPPRELV